MTQRVLVTGAAGFIGSHVCEAFLRRGAEVVGLDNFDPFYDRRFKETNLESIETTSSNSTGSFQFIHGDFCDAQTVQRACQHADSIIHLGAKAGVRPSIEDPVGYVQANLVGTACLLQQAQAAGVKRIVVASSSSVYGNTPATPFSEDARATEPISPYAATKRSTELLGHAHWHLTRQPIAMLRFFTVYGPRQRPDLAIRLFMERIANGQPIRLFGDGSSSRDYTFIDDIVAGVMGAHDCIDQFGFRIWNLGSDQPIALHDLVETIASTVGKKPVIERAPLQPGDVERTWADLTRSKSELSYNPSTSLGDGVAAQWVWHQSVQ